MLEILLLHVLKYAHVN